MPSFNTAPTTEATPVTWRLHREVVLLAGWGRAILLQLAHPLIAQGVADHSGFATDRWGRVQRLRRTLRAMLALTFGTPDEIAAAAAGINRIHDRVHGRLTGHAGALHAGTPYDAHDPALLAWVHATLLDSFLLTYERFIAPLAPATRDRYCREAGAAGPLLGIPPQALPVTKAELDAYMTQMITGGTISVTGTARALATEVLSPRLPWPARPLMALERFATVGLLPPAIRQGYGFEWSERRERALNVLAATTRHALPLVPPLLRVWPAARRAARRECSSSADQAPGASGAVASAGEKSARSDSSAGNGRPPRISAS